MTELRRPPNFTIVYNTETKEKIGFIGKAYEFFYDGQIAQERFEVLIKEGKFPTLRSFHYQYDKDYLGASDRYWIDKFMEQQNGSCL